MAAPPLDVMKEIIAQADVRLAEITSVALAANQRATSLCGMLGAGGIALGAAVLTAVTSGNVAPSLVGAGIIASIGLLLSASLAALACAPRQFNVAGANPEYMRDWAWEHRGDRDWAELQDLLFALGGTKAEAMKHSLAVLKKTNQGTNDALICSASSIVVSVAFYIVVEIIH